MGGLLQGAPSPFSDASSLSIAAAGSCPLVATHHSPILASQTMIVVTYYKEDVEKPGGRELVVSIYYEGRWVLNGYVFPLFLS